MGFRSDFIRIPEHSHGFQKSFLWIPRHSDGFQRDFTDNPIVGIPMHLKGVYWGSPGIPLDFRRDPKALPCISGGISEGSLGIQRHLRKDLAGTPKLFQ